MAQVRRPVPFRTRKLRPGTAMVLHPTGCGRVARRRTTRWASRSSLWLPGGPFSFPGFPSSLRSGNPIFYPRIFCSSSRFFRLTPCGFPEGLFYFPYFLLPSGTPVGLGFRGPRLSILDFHLIPRSPAGAWKSFPLLVFSLRRRGFLLEDRKNYGFGTSCVSHASKRLDWSYGKSHGV